MERHQLSKSTFIRGVQCLKSLYLNKHRPFLRDRLPQERQLVFRRGHAIGELAHKLFPGGVNMSPGHPAAFRKALENTQDHIGKGYPVLYEAAFQHDDVLIFLDILVKTASGWKAYEVKSSRSVSGTYLMDAALQYYVIRGAGTGLEGISIIHINEEYVLEDEVDPRGLFSIRDVTDEALSRQAFVREQIIREKETLSRTSSPPIEVGPHCRQPYDCDFMGHCWKNIPPDNPAEIKGQFNAEAIADLKNIGMKNTAFVKILTLRPALPIFSGTRPYQEIAYAFAIKKGNATATRIFAMNDNPEAEVTVAFQHYLEGTPALVCLDQGWKLAGLAGGNIEVFDLKTCFSDENVLNRLKDGDSVIEKIYEMTGSGGPPAEYSSDAVCAHHFLSASSSEEIPAGIALYAHTSADAVEKLFHFMI